MPSMYDNHLHILGGQLMSGFEIGNNRDLMCMQFT
jgi:hypothetical protein